MKRSTTIALALGCAALPTALAAQVALPGLPAPGTVIDRVTDTLPLDRIDPANVTGLAQRLVSERIERLRALVSRNRDTMEFDDRGNPAVRGVLLVTGADPAAVADLERQGFTVLAREMIEGIDLAYVRLAVPKGQSIPAALRKARKIARGAEISADHLYFASGAAQRVMGGGALATGSSAGQAAIGIIDGGVAGHTTLSAPIEQRGFASGAPAPSAHGTAIASLIAGRGAIRGAAPGAALLVADVYGHDPAGGNAAAIARALGWMVVRGVPVVTMSLVGPDNALLRGAVGAAQRKGVVIVAAVGNDGPAAPPAYPASYADVIAVTGVDARNRALVEAGRSLHLDYAAPGANMLAALPAGGTGKVRGTSYAVPFVAARLSAHYGAVNPAMRALALQRLTREASDLGKKGPDKLFGYGLVCGDCATR